MSKDLDGSQSDGESDDYLIELIGLKDDFPVDALAAYGKIYSRYWRPMLNIAKNFFKDEDDAYDLVQDTFNSVYSKAGSYRKGKIKNKKNIRLIALSWMSTIMKNVFYDLYLDDLSKKTGKNAPLEESYIIENVKLIKHLDNSHDDLIEFLENEETIGQPAEEIFDSVPDNDSANVRKVEEYINKQSERDKDIIRTTYNFYVAGKKTPTEVLDYFEKRWGTTRQNIRKVLEKFRKAIKNDLQAQLYIRK